MNKKYGFVYIWYDKWRKMYYIGCHWGSVDDGYICSSKWMKRAYKNRPEHFKRKILKTGLSREEMYSEEFKLLSTIKPKELASKYYNLNIKQDNPWHQFPYKVKSIGQKISIKKKGKSNGPHSEETKLKIGKTNKGKKRTPEQRKTLSSALKGKKHTQKWKQDNSIRMKKLWADPNYSNPGNTGKSQPESQKLAVSKALKGKKKSKEHCKKISQNNLARSESISSGLKSRWSDPIWAANQRKRLSEGAKNRPPRSQKSKEKTSKSMKETLSLRNR